MTGRDARTDGIPRSERAMLGIDLGTTHCKAGLFRADGSVVRIAARPTPLGRDRGGHPYHEAAALWDAVAEAVREATDGVDAVRVEAIGVAGMAEAGLLVDRHTGRPRTEIVPWFDPRSTAQAETIAGVSDAREQFRRTGLRPSFKYGLSKILWLREREPDVVEGATWLSVPDYLVFRLTGRMVTDPTLAARTYAYDIASRQWDPDWIRSFGLDHELFPDVLPSGAPAGRIETDIASALGLPHAVTAAVAGHDHISALPAAGIQHPGRVLDSVGTAESVLGVLPPGAWDETAFESGLTIVPHVLSDRFCWLGGTPAAGGSIEWLRAQLGEVPVPYDRLEELAREAGPEPTGILWFPYLSGSGAPVHDLHVRAALIGLRQEHGRGHLVRAVLEGTSYEFESIRRAAESLSRAPIAELVQVGGGARNRQWVAIKAAVSNCVCVLPALPDATLLGAAMLAAAGNGSLDPSGMAAIAAAYSEAGDRVEPDPALHHAYQHIFEEKYVPFGIFLRQTP